MSPTKRSGSALGWILAALLIACTVWLWSSRQEVVDAINYHQYEPTPEIRTITKEAALTDEGSFLFYASRPTLEENKTFNTHCERKEANSPILGCYADMRIYIFNVTDDRLDGLKTVTAAHEMLHAAYDRLSTKEKQRLTPLLENAYDKIKTPELNERMAYYAKTQPGERANELHSILGTESKYLGSELEEHYARYFHDRTALADLHGEVEAVFKALSAEARNLAARIDALAGSINQATEAYNQQAKDLARDIATFNQRASRPGGFTSQQEFNEARSTLNVHQASLSGLRQSIEQDIVRYKSLLSRLDAINAESAELNKSLDSALSDVPAI